MFKVELGSDDFYKDSEYVKIGNVAKAIARILLSNDSPNRFQSERDAWPLIHTGIAENKLHPLAPETLDVLSIDNYGNGIVAFSELAEWGVWCHRFNFVKKCAQSASGAKAGEMKALKAKNKARLERAITPQGSVSYALRVDLPTPLEQPDWDYWPYLPTVKPWQACALALNIEPDSVDYRPKSWDGQPETWDGFPSEVGDHFIKLLQLLVANQFEKKHFTKNFSMGVRLSEFAAWCVHVGFAIPPELSALAASPERPQVAPRVEAVPVTSPSGDDMEQTLIDEKIVTNKKIWDDSKLKALWEESILPGVTQKSLSDKYGISRQRIAYLIKTAKNKFSKNISWLNAPLTPQIRTIKGRNY
jgi:hypothetical protein